MDKSKKSGFPQVKFTLNPPVFFDAPQASKVAFPQRYFSPWSGSYGVGTPKRHITPILRVGNWPTDRPPYMGFFPSAREFINIPLHHSMVYASLIGRRM
jgi:hypothetical protein